MDDQAEERGVETWSLPGTNHVYRAPHSTPERPSEGQWRGRRINPRQRHPFGHPDWSKIVANLVVLGADGRKVGVLSAINGDVNAGFIRSWRWRTTFDRGGQPTPRPASRCLVPPPEGCAPIPAFAAASTPSWSRARFPPLTSPGAQPLSPAFPVNGTADHLAALRAASPEAAPVLTARRDRAMGVLAISLSSPTPPPVWPPSTGEWGDVSLVFRAALNPPLATTCIAAPVYAIVIRKLTIGSDFPTDPPSSC